MDRRAVERLQSVNDFDSLLTYLRDELDWPVEDYGFDDLTFQYTGQELGLDDKSAAKVTAIRRLRPLDDEQPWGIFFLELEPKRLPVVALRRLLSKITLKKRASSNRSDSPAWHADDILFISRTGESDERHLTFAHFAANPEKADLPVLKVLGWDASDTLLRVDHVAEVLKEKLIWPDDPTDSEKWRKDWREAFTQSHGARVSTAKEMASQLAQLARRIRGAIREVLAVESENGPMTQIMGDFKKSLVHDLDPEQFADTYAQTITYGLLSARITDPSKNTLDDLASHMQTNPFLKELMESFIHVGGRKKNDSGVGLDFDELGVSDVIELLDNALMEAVVRDFGKHNQQEDPVIHFFEGFLQEYDRSIRKDRGVFYTPRPVVSFIVRSMDELLRTEFGLEDGLADITTWGEMAGRIDDLEIPDGATPEQAFVQILDPATGTGTFLVEVIDLIHNTMTAKWQAEGQGKKKIEELWNAYVPEHLLPRLHGYELMMAPYAIAHMKIGLKLYETGYRFDDDERARVYLTNSLEPTRDFSGTLAFAIPALANEASAVNDVKRSQRYTVVIGNPPYSVNSANKASPIDEHLGIYKEGLEDERNLKPINDDYVKFIRLSHLAIAATGFGLIGMISNHSYATARLFRAMRRSILQDFDEVRFVDLRGEASRDPRMLGDRNVFEIQQGVGISLLLKKSRKLDQFGSVLLYELTGPRAQKYSWLASHEPSDVEWRTVDPRPTLYGFEAALGDIENEYESFVPVDQLFGTGNVGYQTHRDGFVVDIDRGVLISRIEGFRDFAANEEELSAEFGIRSNRDWSILAAHASLRGESDVEGKVRETLYRPFDIRHICYSPALIDYDRFELMRHMASSNVGLLVSKVYDEHEFTSALATKWIVESKAADRTRGSYLFPLRVCGDGDQLLSRRGQPTKCPSNMRADQVERLGVSLAHDCAHVASPGMVSDVQVLGYVYAVLYSPMYRRRYADLLMRNFPGIPRARAFGLFTSLASLGTDLVSLHTFETSTNGNHAPTVTGSGEFRVEKTSYSDQTVWIDKAKLRGFKGVPEEVWNFHIGGYQVCEKWLKDRQAKGGKNPRPGRVLTDEDIEHYQKIVVALSETIRIQAEIDEVIEAHGGWPDAFQTVEAADKPASDVSYGEADEGDTQLDMVAEPRDG